MLGIFQIHSQSVLHYCEMVAFTMKSILRVWKIHAANEALLSAWLKHTVLESEKQYVESDSVNAIPDAEYMKQ